jgi:serine/threonine protein kinase
MMRSEGRMSDMIARTLFKQIVNAVKCLHENGVCHRNIKLENVMMNGDYEIKLVDFTLSGIFEGKNAQQIVEICGTPLYMAPELHKVMGL